MAIVFTADEFGEGATAITAALKQANTKASFFFTGRFYNNKKMAPAIATLRRNGHYLGAHSHDHLLYNDWKNRDSLLVSRRIFETDLLKNYAAMKKHGIAKKEAFYFLPPYEWYNDSIARWTSELGLQLINHSPGTLSAADYTWPALPNYRSSETIMQSIKTYEAKSASGLNGFILLLHLGTDPARTDKFYHQLPQLLVWLKKKGYELVTVDELMEEPARLPAAKLSTQ